MRIETRGIPFENRGFQTGGIESAGKDWGWDWRKCTVMTWQRGHRRWRFGEEKRVGGEGGAWRIGKKKFGREGEDWIKGEMGWRDMCGKREGILWRKGFFKGDAANGQLRDMGAWILNRIG
jgi:hypothetical protein